MPHSFDLGYTAEPFLPLALILDSTVYLKDQVPKWGTHRQERQRPRGIHILDVNFAPHRMASQNELLGPRLLDNDCN